MKKQVSMSLKSTGTKHGICLYTDANGLWYFSIGENKKIEVNAEDISGFTEIIVFSNAIICKYIKHDTNGNNRCIYVRAKKKWLKEKISSSIYKIDVEREYIHLIGNNSINSVYVFAHDTWIAQPVWAKHELRLESSFEHVEKTTFMNRPCLRTQIKNHLNKQGIYFLDDINGESAWFQIWGYDKNIRNTESVFYFISKKYAVVHVEAKEEQYRAFFVLCRLDLGIYFEWKNEGIEKGKEYEIFNIQCLENYVALEKHPDTKDPRPVRILETEGFRYQEIEMKMNATKFKGAIIEDGKFVMKEDFPEGPDKIIGRTK